MKNGDVKLKAILPISFIIVSLWASVCLAQGPNASQETKCPEGRSGLKKNIVQELNLTEEQTAKLAESRKQNQAQRKETSTALKETRTKLWQELDKVNSDQKEVVRLSADVKRLQAQMVDNQIKSIANIKNILTPEQYEKFKERIKEKRGMHKGQRGPQKTRGEK